MSAAYTDCFIQALSMTLANMKYLSPRNSLIVFPTSRKFKIFSNGGDLRSPSWLPLFASDFSCAILLLQWKSGKKYITADRRRVTIDVKRSGFQIRFLVRSYACYHHRLRPPAFKGILCPMRTFDAAWRWIGTWTTEKSERNRK